MAGEIRIQILGDSGPFSRSGKSVGYRVSVGPVSYLLDCGVPLFEEIGGHGLKELKGVLVTHCHDDHKRWFTDLALFHRYAPDMGSPLVLLTSEAVHEALERASGPALERSLSGDSMTVVDMPYDGFVDRRILGPRARFTIAAEGGLPEGWRVVDDSGASLGPGEAKVVVHPGTGRPRMLLRDPDYGEWIDPATFYSFTSSFFYNGNGAVFRDGEMTVEALNAPAWHGLPSVAIRFSTEKERVVFSSDTVHDRSLWERLCSVKRPQRLGMSREEFDASPVIRGDINDYVERTWSRERHRDAVTAFEEAVVVHDVAVRDCVVHTHYRNIASFGMERNRVLLTHSPDRMTSVWPLTGPGKTFSVRGGTLCEEVDGRAVALDADIYHKEEGKFFVGYRNPEGKHLVYEGKGYLTLDEARVENEGVPLFKVDLYEEIDGRYYPHIEDESASYRRRLDGRVELVTSSESGSSGVVVRPARDRSPVNAPGRRPS